VIPVSAVYNLTATPPASLPRPRPRVQRVHECTTTPRPRYMSPLATPTSIITPCRFNTTSSNHQQHTTSTLSTASVPRPRHHHVKCRKMHRQCRVHASTLQRHRLWSVSLLVITTATTSHQPTPTTRATLPANYQHTTSLSAPTLRATTLQRHVHVTSSVTTTPMCNASGAASKHTQHQHKLTAETHSSTHKCPTPHGNDAAAVPYRRAFTPQTHRNPLQVLHIIHTLSTVSGWMERTITCAESQNWGVRCSSD